MPTQTRLAERIRVTERLGNLVTSHAEVRQHVAEVQRLLAERQRNLEAEHRLTVELQQIILPVPETPVDLPGLRVAVRYLPAEHITRVGGDWYHASALPSGHIVLAIGDVAGHGLRAAATMSQLRHAVAALAVATTDPAKILSYLNRLLYEDGTGSTATAVVGCYDPARQVLTWALTEAIRAAPDQPLAEVLVRLRQASPDDDTCVLAVRSLAGHRSGGLSPT